MSLPTTLSEELRSLETSKGLAAFLKASYGSSPVPAITPYLFQTGHCEDLAYYLHRKHGARIAFIDHFDIGGHYFVEHEGRFYDSLHPDGVERASQLSHGYWARVSDPLSSTLTSATTTTEGTRSTKSGTTFLS